ncbi:MAG: tetratricopeptide repeat protein [Gammaproteobacteria bacterium]
MIEKLEAMLAAGHDSSGLRFTLANHYLKQNDSARAVEHAQVAVALDPDYSAAWRLLGQAQVAAGKPREAASSFERGIEVAQRLGDRQVEKEMHVFLKRLRKADSSDEQT